MSSADPASPEVLIQRKRHWLARLWVRVTLVLLLIVCITVGMWCWPRRGMLAVYLAGGSVYCVDDRPRAVNLMNWAYPSGWTSPAFDKLICFLCLAHTDDEITSINLHRTTVDGRWLSCLTRFPKLNSVALNDDHLGPGLDVLRHHSSLQNLSVYDLSDPHWQELSRCPQLESLMIIQPQHVEKGVEHLTSLPRLNELHLQDCEVTNEFLANLPELPELTSMNFFKCPMKDDDLVHLRKLPNLKSLDLCKSGPFNDEGLIHLSRLTNLEGLFLRVSSGQFTDSGLQGLKSLDQVQEFIFIRGDFSPSQVQTLQQTLPKARMLVR